MPVKRSRVFDRWCPSGQHHRPLGAFRQVVAGERLPRDCTNCEAARAEAMLKRAQVQAAPPLEAVDIDAIHRRPARWWAGSKS